jgi:hypothetical protein
LSWAKSNLAGAGYALLVAVAAFVIAGGTPSKEALVAAAIAFGVAAVLFVLAKYGLRLVRLAASLPIRIAVFGLKSWGELSRGKRAKDTLWDWFIDQLLVVQHRYAFSVGCIAFAEGDPKRCLMIRRKFQGFGDEDVVLWPGGRLRGTLEDFATEVRRLVQRETGCTVTLIGAAGIGSTFAEKLNTWNPESRHADIENDLLAPPILVMQQNRRQSHEVPGHIDLLYLGTVGVDERVSNRGMWLDLRSLSQYAQAQLWPDTRKCVERAAACYAEMLAASGRETVDSRDVD